MAVHSWAATSLLYGQVARSTEAAEEGHPTQWLRSRKVRSARRTDFGIFRHLIPAVANERSCRNASANNEKWNANDCTAYSPEKWNANDCTDYSPAK
jgi:hypothetical protein